MTITCEIISRPVAATPATECWRVVCIEGDKLVEVSADLPSVEAAEKIINEQPRNYREYFALRRCVTEEVPGQDGEVELRMSYLDASGLLYLKHPALNMTLRNATGGVGPHPALPHGHPIEYKCVRPVTPATLLGAYWIIVHAGMAYPDGKKKFTTADAAMNHAESIQGGPYDVRRIITPGVAADHGALHLKMSWTTAREIAVAAKSQILGLYHTIMNQIG